MYNKIIFLYVVLLFHILSLEAKTLSKQDIAFDLKKTIQEMKYSDNLIKNLNKQINLSRTDISNSQDKVNKLNKTYFKLRNNINNLTQHNYDLKNNLFKLFTKKYSISMIIQHSNKKSDKSFIDKAVYTILFDNIKKRDIKIK